MKFFENFTKFAAAVNKDLEIFDISIFITLQYQVQHLRLDKLSLNCIYLKR